MRKRNKRRQPPSSKRKEVSTPKQPAPLDRANSEAPAPTEPDYPSPPSRTIITHSEWRGPVPDPETLAKFNEAEPGAAGRIFGMAEESQKHSHRLESRGQLMAFGVSVATLAAGVFLIYTEKLVMGYTLSGVSGVGLAISAIRAIVAMFQRPEPAKDDE